MTLLPKKPEPPAPRPWHAKLLQPPGLSHPARPTPHRARLALLSLALALPVLGGAARAQTVLDFVSAPSVEDLQCPNPLLQPPSGGDVAGHRPSLAGSQVPSLGELGALARTVIRAQPRINPQTIPGLALQDFKPPRHIAIWGDSHIAAGPMMPTLLQALRARGVSTGAYFLPPTMGRANVRLPGLRASCAGPGWDTELSYALPTPLLSGPALANRTAVAGPDSYLWLDLRDPDRRALVREVRIVYRVASESTLEISVNDGPTRRVALSPRGDGATETLILRGDAPVATVKLQVGQGRLLLYGFILDHIAPPALTLDVFGIPSATVRGWANADPDYLQQTLHGVHYDGVMLEYGTNEGNARDFNRAQYAALLTEALTHMRQVFPAASCLLIGPPDRGVLSARRADLLRFAHTHQLIEATQREVGRRFGCAVWNWQDLMGGPGGNYGWFYAAPPLMGHDLTHLSAAGYEQTGQALARSLGWRD